MCVWQAVVRNVQGRSSWGLSCKSVFKESIQILHHKTLNPEPYALGVQDLVLRVLGFALGSSVDDGRRGLHQVLSSDTLLSPSRDDKLSRRIFSIYIYIHIYIYTYK